MIGLLLLGVHSDQEVKCLALSDVILGSSPAESSSMGWLGCYTNMLCGEGLSTVPLQLEIQMMVRIPRNS